MICDQFDRSVVVVVVGFIYKLIIKKKTNNFSFCKYKTNKTKINDFWCLTFCLSDEKLMKSLYPHHLNTHTKKTC